ncbi:phosphoribosylanthranilate isomerase [Gemmatimonas groenlandica]|uniref:N-(5'-phosphoribosyl)anthranilate isomerase n=1 Tax=Gemmatimonas groenlandica TaxID=2732249 RepID=A0A6M4INI7_9BACT|nr:phosphoribosylanthranilate isomerase [Gemmatimonas groenlandica]QJR34986.1 phosphoribosylanthranilate isomerase [Gemmatimonas groenlandica]
MTTATASGRDRALPVEVKICGLTRERDAAHAVHVGASYVGAIMAGGPRLLTVDRARAVLGPRRHDVQRVVVFGDQHLDDVIVTVQTLDLDIAQLHGHCSVASIDTIRRKTGRMVWPVLRVAGTTLPVDAVALGAAAGAVVLDAHVVGQLGGTGVTLDWSGLRDAVEALRESVPGIRIILAGGLRPGNVIEAIRLLSPDVVDVSSGVESETGVKDSVLVEQFVAAARSAAGMQR